ncbi:Serotransferrin [Larimichthys crocea]|uniref:Serotransferrin n=1 Tax=Larimichthys crocea TaxID=215358 RepID=A0A6G0J4N5_LARCR|nr:Serotransferrin [Larimichthys crocea]
MQSNGRRPDLVRARAPSSSCGAEAKAVRKVQSRKVPYRVGYSWNRGGRLKELRIRHLARKFLKIWIQKTFGRVLPHEARSHYRSVVLRRAFEGWKDEWWASRREWSLTMRAECHHRYYLCNLAFRSWRTFMTLQREKKSKIQDAQSFADRQRMRLVLDRWEVFTEMRRMKNRMLQSALELNRLTTLHSVWSLWQTRLQQQQDLYALEEQALKQKALTLQSRTWLQWKAMHTAACCQREKEAKAARHFILRLKGKTLRRWKSYVSCLQIKKKSQAVAQCAYHLHLMMTCWSKWSSALLHKQSEEVRLQAAGHLAVRSSQRRALERWRSYVTLCREEDEKNRIASRHHRHHLLRAGLQGLSLNVIRNKTHRLNNNMAVQHYHQTMTNKYWKLWQDRLEEAEDECFQPQREMALTTYSTSLMSSCFHYWREKLAEQRHMQELERRADMWFAERVLPLCFNSWVDFTLQRRLREQRKHKAEVYNRQRQYTWVFYTWWGHSENHKEQMLSERMAVLHEEQCRLQRAWSRWRQRTEQRIKEEEKREASERLYLHRLLRKTVTQWKDNSTEIRHRRNQEQQACRQGDLRCMRWAVEKWKQFVQSQRVKRSRLKQMQRYHEVKLLKRTIVAWKTHHLQISQVYAHAEELYTRHKQNSLRKVLSVWRENAVLLAEVRLMEQRAQDHFQHFLQLKVLLAWREATTRAVSKHHQQEEAVSRAQRSINQVRLLRSLRRWRKRTREARREWICMEKARRHHESELLSKAMKAWNVHHSQYQKNKVMKRQGIILLRLKMYQTYFELWKVKLQHRRREAKQTERALWHWSLTLQAKVLYGWRLLVTGAAQETRADGPSCTGLQGPAAEGGRDVHPHLRCSHERPHNEPNTTQPGAEIAQTCPESAEQEDEVEMLSKLMLSSKHRLQPRRREDLFLEINAENQSDVTSAEAAPKPSQLSGRTVLSCHHPAQVSSTSTDQTIITSNVSSCEPHTSTMDSPHETRDILLPPSAFMTIGAEDKGGTSSLDVRLRASRGKAAEIDPASDLTRELLDIRLEMKTYQQDRKQLRAWQKLKEVLRSWLRSSGKDEQVEKHAVCQELKELEERIDRTVHQTGETETNNASPQREDPAFADCAHRSQSKKMRWCTVSDPEQRKCAELAKTLVAVLPPAVVAAYARLSCIRASSTTDCIDRIRGNRADIVTLDAGEVYSAVKQFGLVVVAKEIYSDGGCILSVAVVRNSTLDIRSLQGLRTCHSGVRWTAGWSLPLGFLLSRNYLSWSKEQPLSQDVSTFFSASCIPGAAAMAPPLCSLCQGHKSYIRQKNYHCETSHSEPFYNNQGALRCLRSGAGDVAFVDHLALESFEDSDRDEFRLLCTNGTQAPLSHYRVVIWVVVQMLFGQRGRERQRFQLFNSSSFGENDLLFKDVTDKLAVLPDDMEVSQVLGLDYVALLKGLGHEGSSLEDSVVRWCCISHAEQKKCEQWALSIKSDPLVCVKAASIRDCIEKIKRDEVDAVSLDATHSFIAGRCGLVPVVTEYYGRECVPAEGSTHLETDVLPSVVGVAVAKRSSRSIFIGNLGGRRSCHGHMYSPAGWLLPYRHTLSLEHNSSSPCDPDQVYNQVFWKGCLPGSQGNLCKVCMGGTGEAATKRCADNHNERYYGNMGALRCLVGDPSGKSYGDVAFLEQHNLQANILNLGSTGWADGWASSDFELLCGDGRRAPLSEWESCNLGVIPPNTIMTRPVLTARVYDFLMKSQETLAANPNAEFKLFESLQYGESDLLFKDATQCFVHTSHLDYRSILGDEFYNHVETVFNCTHSDILEFCNQDVCSIF